MNPTPVRLRCAQSARLSEYRLLCSSKLSGQMADCTSKESKCREREIVVKLLEQGDVERCGQRLFYQPREMSVATKSTATFLRTNGELILRKKIGSLRHNGLRVTTRWDCTLRNGCSKGGFDPECWSQRVDRSSYFSYQIIFSRGSVTVCP